MLPVAGLIVVVLTSASPVEGKRIAVLEFKNATPRQLTSLDAMADEARGGAAALLNPQGGKVLTKENMLEVLKVTGGVCREGECEVETARNLNVDYFVTGTLSEVSNTLLLALKVFDTRQGDLKMQLMLESRSELDLVKLVRNSTATLLISGLDLGARIRGTGGMEGRINGAGAFEFAEEQTVICTFESIPKGAVVSLDGVFLCKETPCSRPISLGAHTLTMALEDYEETRSSISVTQTARNFSQTLPPAFGTASLSVQPRGTGLSLDGSPLSVAPGSWIRLAPGAHELVIEDACFERTGERFVVQKGQKTQVELTATPRMAVLKVKTLDGKGNTVDGEVFADGVKVGTTWKRFKIPLCAKNLLVRASNGDEIAFHADLAERTEREVDLEVLDLMEDPMLHVPASQREVKRMEIWERRTAPARGRAVGYTFGAVGAGVATVGAAITWQAGTAEREKAANAYTSATSNHDALYGAYERAYWTSTISGPAALMGLVLTGWLGWSAWSAWGDVPVRPSFSSDGRVSAVSISGDIP